MNGLAETPVPEIGRHVVDRAKEGDQAALAELYDWYLPRVYRYVLTRVGKVADAEDLTEEVFLKMLGAIDGFVWRAETPFSAWLFRIAHNQVVSHFRKNASRSGTTSLFDGIIDQRQDPAAHIETKLTLEEVFRICADLPEAQRDVLALRFAAGLSVAETANALGKREGNVKTLQHKAISRLQKIMSEDGARRRGSKD